MNTKLTIFFILTSSCILDSYAGSATWNLNPTNNSWGAASNWTPATVPNGSSDVATFDVSNTTAIDLGLAVKLDRMVFNPGASSFTFTVSEANLTISGLGVVNNSGVTQNFTNSLGSCTFIGTASAGDINFTINGALRFEKSTSAGSATIANNPIMLGTNYGLTSFSGDATAGNAIITNKGGGGSNGIFGGLTMFFDHANAGNAIITNEGGLTDFSGDGGTLFISGGNGGNATLISNGGGTANADGSLTEFSVGSNAGNATLIANSSPFAGTLSGGQILFSYDSDGGTCRVMVFGNGSLALTTHDDSPITIGSIEGDGLVIIGFHDLIVGSNNHSTVFSGHITSQGGDGTMTKIGRGSLTLTKGNSYSAGTFIRGGQLIANNKNGSATGTSPVQIDFGGLAGRGIIAGPVTVGDNGGRLARISPGSQSDEDTDTLTVQNIVTFNSDGIYAFQVDSDQSQSDILDAAGLTINAGAQFMATDLGTSALAPGTMFTAVNNTAVGAINGTFANLVDGSTVTIGNNNFQVNYEGGDGNDLTLTVVSAGP